MATGPEHYQLAEVAQDAAAAMQASRPGGPEATATEALLDALVHALLANAAAAALNDGGDGMGAKDYDSWREAASASPPPRP